MLAPCKPILHSLISLSNLSSSLPKKNIVRIKDLGAIGLPILVDDWLVFSKHSIRSSYSNANQGSSLPSTFSLVGSPLTCHTPSLAVTTPTILSSIALLLLCFHIPIALSYCLERRSLTYSSSAMMCPTITSSSLLSPVLGPRLRVSIQNISDHSISKYSSSSKGVSTPNSFFNQALNSLAASPIFLFVLSA